MSNSVLPPSVVVDPNRGYREWHISEIYAPSNPASKGKYVPNPDDAVRDWTQGILRVVSVDYTNGVSILQRWTEPAEPRATVEEDILIGAGPGYQSESYRCFYDSSVFPHTLTMDHRLHYYGTGVSSIKIFLGTDISEHGDVISAHYDASGNLLGDNIPVDEVAMFQNGVVIPGGAASSYNLAVRAARVGHTTRKLNDGDVVTVVSYSDGGQVASRAKLLIKTSKFIRQTDSSLKYVASIALETPFLLSSDPSVIEYPHNMPVDNLNLMGVVTYSDGQQLRMPVDGTKFSIAGLRNYIATIQGQTVDLMLSYQLSPHESAYLISPSPNGRINVPYHARTKESDGAYSVKLFAYPVWMGALNGYRLEYFLYNLDRQQVYYVTNLVSNATNSAAFDPLLYGVKQRINVGVNMNEVDPLFDSWRHAQAFEITLLRPGNASDGDNWTVGFTPGQNPAYGVGVRALTSFINVGNTQLNISCGAESLNDWLDKVYYPTQPLFDARSETGPLVPNFMVIASGNERIEVPISNWNSVIALENEPAAGKPVYIEFLRKTADNDLQLSIAALITHRSSAVLPDDIILVPGDGVIPPM